MYEGSAVLLINSLSTGGAERAVRAAAARLRAVGRNISVVCLESTDTPTALGPDVPVHLLSRMSASAGPLLKFAALPILAFRLAAYLSKSGARTVMSHLFRANFVNVLARTLARSRHRAILVNHTRLSRLSAEGVQGRITWLLCRLLYRRADLVCSVSTGAARECGRLLGLGESRSITLYDPVDTAPAGGGTDREKRLVAVGRLVALKRFQDLIQAFARISADFPGLSLHVAGDGPERARLERCADNAGLSGRIRFLGQVAGPASALRGAAAFVSTSDTEGFGMAIVEALAAGVPVIASDCPYGPREILSPATDPVRLLPRDAGIELAPFGILYPVASIDALERALRMVLTNNELRHELGQKGPMRAADFSIERSAAAYENLLFA